MTIPTILNAVESGLASGAAACIGWHLVVFLQEHLERRSAQKRRSADGILTAADYQALHAGERA